MTSKRTRPRPLAAREASPELERVQPAAEPSAVEPAHAGPASARKGAAKGPPGEALGAGLMAFHIVLQLGEGGEVVETSVTAIRHEGEKSRPKRWRGWRPDELCDYMSRQIGHAAAVNPAAAEPPSAIAPALPAPRPAGPELPPPTPLEQMTRELAFVPTAEGEPLRITCRGTPLRGRLTLDLAALPPTVAPPEVYSVTLRAKRLGSGQRILLGEARGALPAEPRLTVTSDMHSLPAGLYRLEALVALESQRGAWPDQADLPLQGGLMLVY